MKQARPVTRAAANPAANLPPAHGLARGLLLAALVVEAVRGQGRSTREVLPELARRYALDARDRGMAQDLAFHALRRLGAAQCLRTQLVPKAPKPAWLAALLDVSLVLLPGLMPGAMAGGSPHYAAPTLVDQAVRAARSQPALTHGAGLINACLRRALREADSLHAGLTRQAAAHSHPAWWVERLRRDHGVPAADGILKADQCAAPMVLRVNRRQLAGTEYLQRLAAAGLAAEAITGCDGALRLLRPCAVERLPGFAAGQVSVQDLAAQLAAHLLAPATGERVLDACAAPGGKSAHLLERAPIDLWALDADAERLQRVHDTLTRLRLTADEAGAARSSVRVVQADAAEPGAWWDGQMFDAILLDAPCSASGIVRRHPDIQWLRRAADIDTLAAQQQRLLDALWPLLRPGGRLLYATCSVFAAEGELQAQAFLARHADARAADLHAVLRQRLSGLRLRLARQAPASAAQQAVVGLQLLPGVAPRDAPGTSAPAAETTQDHDGFYYALFSKLSPPS